MEAITSRKGPKSASLNAINTLWDSPNAWESTHLNDGCPLTAFVFLLREPEPTLTRESRTRKLRPLRSSVPRGGGVAIHPRFLFQSLEMWGVKLHKRRSQRNNDAQDQVMRNITRSLQLTVSHIEFAFGTIPKTRSTFSQSKPILITLFWRFQ